MPFAGGPLAYGRRAVGPWLGFLMGWSMLLESLFATIGTAIARGLHLFHSRSAGEGFEQTAGNDGCGLVTVLLFAILQWRGVHAQARIMEWMTYGAIVALVWFWIACIPGINIDRLFTKPILHSAGEGSCWQSLTHLVAGDHRIGGARG